VIGLYWGFVLLMVLGMPQISLSVPLLERLPEDDRALASAGMIVRHHT
jgi:hypothetical protein